MLSSPALRVRNGLISIAIAAALLFPFGSFTDAAQDVATASCAIETTERVIAIADVHGAYDRFVLTLRAAGLIDGRQRWSGGRAIFVQTGDVLDRGPDSRRALDLLRRMESEASRAGGRVHALLGNHEIMRMLGDLRFVSTGEYAAFRSIDSEEVRERYYRAVLTDAAARAKASNQRFVEAAFRKGFLHQTPLGWVEMQIAFGPKGEYGRWLRERDTMVKINGTLFVHGGISLAVATMGCATVNATVRSELTAAPASFSPQQMAALLASREDGPLWYRGLAQENESAFASALDAILLELKASAIVVGHTVTANGRLTSRFGGRVVQLDTGMLGGIFYPAGRASALEIRNGQFTAIYEDRRAVVQDRGREVTSLEDPARVGRSHAHQLFSGIEHGGLTLLRDQ
jgi:hypothetical protein